jgi:hypothetical protein
MSHYAQVTNGIVTQVIVAEQDFINSGAVGNPANWIQTSYNTRGGVHYAPNSNTPDGGVPLRGNYAGIGYTYDSINDVFYAPKPYPSWIISGPTWLWQPPVARPSSGQWFWDETNVQWVEQIEIITGSPAATAITTFTPAGSSFYEVITVNASGSAINFSDTPNTSYPIIFGS